MQSSKITLSKEELRLFQLIKSSGEGSRGGRIIGHTRSGKPIYETGYHHPSVKDFTKEDHKDAKRMHLGYAEFLDPHPEEGGGSSYKPDDEDDMHVDISSGRVQAKHHAAQAAHHNGHLAEKNDNIIFHHYAKKALFFIQDLFKSGNPRANHKYIRRYCRNNKWIYIYHEPNAKPRRLEDVHVEALKRLAETGHDESKQLIENVEDHNENNLKLLRKLADTGYRPAIDHLRSIGIDRDMEKLEEIATPDLVTKSYTEEEKAKALNAIKEAMTQTIERWKAHPNSTFEQAARAAGILKPTGWDLAITDADSSYDLLKKLNEKLNSMESKYNSTPSWDLAKNAGGYGNLIYNTAIQKLEAAELLPRKYSDAHERTKENAETLEPHGEKQHKEKLAAAQAARTEAERQARERERREREEREQREREERERIEAEERAISAEVDGSMAQWMGSVMDRSMEPSEVQRLHRHLKAMFDKDMRKEDWPYNFSDAGFDVKIKSYLIKNDGLPGISFELEATKDGRTVTDGWSRVWKKQSNGGVKISNSYMVVNSSARTNNFSINVSKNQIEFLKAHSPKGSIGVHAALTVGGYNWANHGFAFSGDHDMLSTRRDFKAYLYSHGVMITDEELSHFTLPCHFASFDTGKRIARQGAGAIGNIQVHLGKDFMLGRGWYGIIKIEDLEDPDSDASEAVGFFNTYRSAAESWSQLETAPVMRKYKEKYEISANTPPRTTPTATEQPSVEQPSEQQSATTRMVERYSQHWSLGRGSRITLSPRRLRIIAQWTTDQRNHFIQLNAARLSIPQKRRILRVTTEELDRVAEVRRFRRTGTANAG